MALASVTREQFEIRSEVEVAARCDDGEKRSAGLGRHGRARLGCIKNALDRGKAAARPGQR